MRTDKEIAEVVLKYGEFFAELETQAKEYAEDMQKVQILERKYSEMYREIHRLRSKWRKGSMSITTEQFCRELIKENGFDLDEADQAPNPFKRS